MNDNQPVPPSRRAEFITDPISGATAEVRRIQPYQALKDYVCPGCNQEVRKGTGHIVVVPMNEPSMRRHWHEACLRRGLVG